MGKLVFRVGICSIFLAAAIFGAAAGSSGPAHAGGNSSNKDRLGAETKADAGEQTPDVSSGSAEDFGGTPSSVQSLSPSTGGKPRPATGQSDQTNARQAVERGEVRPFGWLLKKLGKAVPGDVVKVRLKRHGADFWTYDVTVLNASGRYVLVSMNAATGAIISSKNR